jgi:hypothetical protein
MERLGEYKGQPLALGGRGWKLPAGEDAHGRGFAPVLDLPGGGEEVLEGRVTERHYDQLIGVGVDGSVGGLQRSGALDLIAFAFQNMLQQVA